MAPTTTRGAGDLFDSAAVWLVIVLLAVFTVATLAVFAVIYYGDDVHTPSWSERSVPPPAPAP